jgi:tetratricopeptide (TPR) repeat protein
VLPKAGYVVKAGKTVIDSYDKPVLRLPWIVQGVNGPWLLVGGSRKGWVQRSQVVTLAEAPVYYTDLINKYPDDAWAYNLRGLAWQERNELNLAINDFNQVLRLEPTAVAFDNRGNVFQAMHEYKKAIADYDQAILSSPVYYLAYVGRGLAWAEEHEYDKAIADYNEALRINPGYARAYNRRGLAWAAKREFAKAAADYKEAIRIDPNYASAFRDLAWLLATCPDAAFRDGRGAVENATKACELTGWDDAECLETLACAYAEASDYDSALKYEKKAIALRQDDVAFVQSARERLALYEEKKPYRN